MKRSLVSIVSTLILAGAIAGCSGTKTQAYVESSGISKQNNPFVYALDYRVEDSFELLGEPVEGLRGTVVESRQGQLVAYSSVNDVAFNLNFTWIGIRDQFNQDTYYLIYPVDRNVPLNTRVEIQRYWPIESDMALTNNQLVYILTPNYDGSWEGTGILDHENMSIDRVVESSAPDGLIDGIIKIGGIKYLGPEE